jgi:hypothetical protein
MITIGKYADSIVSVRDKATLTDLSHTPRELLLMTHINSNIKTPVARLKLNGDLVKKHNSILIGYICTSCNVKSEITLNLFLRKINRNIDKCNACKNLDEGKRTMQASYMRGEYIPHRKELWSEKSLSTRVEESCNQFSSESYDFQSSYYIKHLTVEDFDRIRSKIISIGNDKIRDVSKWKYIPTYRVCNQSRYTPMLINWESNAIEKPSYIKWSCDSCSTSFVNRDIEVQKNRLRILCAECSFCNRTFKVKSMDTKWGKLRYQSQQEFRFIKWCIDHDIKIINGPNIPYMWNEKKHSYRVDFQLPDHKRLVELKDNHIWHKYQIENGKWGAKEMCAKEWCVANSWEYDLVFPMTLAKWKDHILKSL